MGGFNYTHDELLLSDNMVKYWTNFAHTGNPNKGQSQVKRVPWACSHFADLLPLHFSTYIIAYVCSPSSCSRNIIHNLTNTTL